MNYYILRRTTGLLYTAEFAVDLAVLCLALYFRVRDRDRESLRVFLLGGFYNSVIELLAQGSHTRTITSTSLFHLIPVGYPLLPLIMGFFEGGILILIGYHLVRFLLNRDGRSGRIAGGMTGAMVALTAGGAGVMKAMLHRSPESLIVTRRALFSPGSVVILFFCYAAAFIYFLLRKDVTSRDRRGLLAWCAGLPLISALWYTPLFLFGLRFMQWGSGGVFTRIALSRQILLLYGYSIVFEAAGFYLPVFIIIHRAGLLDPAGRTEGGAASSRRRSRYALGFILAAAVLGAAGGMASFRPSPPAGVTVHEDIAYLPDRLPSHRLDLYLPRGKKDFPVLVFVHGGGWRRGDKRGSLGAYIRLGQSLAREGIGVAVINYRLAPAVSYREQVRDVVAALRWTTENISRYGGDPGRIFLGGHSAGAHLALLSEADPFYSAPPVRGIIFWSGIADINLAMETSPEVMKRGLYEAAFGNDPRQWRRASPLNFLSHLQSPLLILYGGRDFEQIRRQAILLLYESRKLDLPVSCRVIAGKSHLTEVSSFPARKSAAREAVTAFIRKR